MKTINFGILTSDALYTFAQRFADLFQGRDMAALGMDLFYNRVTKTLSDYDSVLKRDMKDPYTLVTAEKDRIRDERFVGFRDYVAACAHRESEEMQQASERVMKTIERYGYSAQAMGYKNETAALNNLITDIETNHVADLTSLVADEWFNELKTAQQDFEAVMQSRITETVTDELTIKETRRPLEKALRNMMAIIELQHSMTADATLKEIIDDIDPLITRTMSTARAAQTRKEAE